MPTYNRADYIGETIESIRNQTYQNWELIIVDDGSEDNTEQIIEKINDRRIRFFKAGRTGVHGKIKNIGLEKAVGEMIALIHSDDLWASTKIEKQLMAFEQYPEAMFCMTGGYNFRKLNEPLNYFYKQTEGANCNDLLKPFIKSEAAGTVSTLLLKKECLRISGGFDETKSISDMYFILNLASHFKGVILYESLFYRRLHDSNDSSMNWVKRHYEGLEMLKSFRRKLPQNLIADSLFRSHMHFGEKCLSNSRPITAIGQFLQAWKYKPLSFVPLKKIAKSVFHFSK
jgi:glycosyltransferase involved in cell wall biosynthesis